MSSGIKIDPASPSNLDYSHGNNNHSDEQEDGEANAATNPGSHIDRSGPEKQNRKSLGARKTQKKQKKKKMAQRRVREHGLDQNND